MISRTLLAIAATTSLTLVGCVNAVKVRQEMVYDVQSGAYNQAIPKVNDLYGCVQKGDLPSADAKDLVEADDVPPKNELLWRMERGAIDTQRGDTQGALQHLDRAAQLVIENRTASLTREVGTYIANDNAQAYAGYSFEHILVDYHRTIAAILAAQRAQKIMPPVTGEEPNLDMSVQAMNNIARGMTIEKIQYTKDTVPGLRYEDDPYARVIAACVYLATPVELRARDDQGFAFTQLAAACRAYKKMATTLGGASNLRYEVSGIPAVVQQLTILVGSDYDPKGLESLAQEVGITLDGSVKPLAKDQGLILVLNHADWVTPIDVLSMNFVVGVLAAPDVSEDEKLRGVTVTAVGAFAAGNAGLGAASCWAKGPGSEVAQGWTDVAAVIGAVGQVLGQINPGTWIGFEMPVHRGDNAIPAPGSAIIGGKDVKLQVVDDIDAFSRSTLKDLQPGILAKTLGRVVAKHIAAIAAEKAAEAAAGDDNNKKIIAALLGTSSHALASASESADTRHWGLLPNRVEAALAIVPAGEQSVSIQTTAGTQELGTVKVPAGRLVIVPARTFPAPMPCPYPNGVAPYAKQPEAGTTAGAIPEAGVAPAPATPAPAAPGTPAAPPAAH
ncbi:MAG: hypothetical protein AAB263_15315 [Planctomycetota bacterium]